MTLDLIETLNTSIYTPKSHTEHENAFHFSIVGKYFKTKKKHLKEKRNDPRFMLSSMTLLIFHIF